MKIHTAETKIHAAEANIHMPDDFRHVTEAKYMLRRGQYSLKLTENTVLATSAPHNQPQQEHPSNPFAPQLFSRSLPRKHYRKRSALYAEGGEGIKLSESGFSGLVDEQDEYNLRCLLKSDNQVAHPDSDN